MKKKMSSELKMNFKRTFQYFWKEWMRYKFLFWGLVITMVIVQLLNMAVPIIYKGLVDLIIDPNLPREEVLRQLYWIAGKYALLLLSVF